MTLGNEIYHGIGTSIKRAQQVGKFIRKFFFFSIESFSFLAAEQALSMTNLRKPESTTRASRNNHPQRINPPRESMF